VPAHGGDLNRIRGFRESGPNMRVPVGFLRSGPFPKRLIH
jgi:hypothetical protein